MVKKDTVLAKVKRYIGKELDSAKVNFYGHTWEDDYNFMKSKSISEILKELEISKVDYERNLHYQLQVMIVMM